MRTVLHANTNQRHLAMNKRARQTKPNDSTHTGCAGWAGERASERQIETRDKEKGFWRSPDESLLAPSQWQKKFITIMQLKSTNTLSHTHTRPTDDEYDHSISPFVHAVCYPASRTHTHKVAFSFKLIQFHPGNNNNIRRWGKRHRICDTIFGANVWVVQLALASTLSLFLRSLCELDDVTAET